MTQETPWWDSNPQITVLQTAALTVSPHEEKKQRVVTPKVIVFASLSSVSVCYQQALIDLLRHHSLMDGHFQAYQLFLCFVISTGLEPVRTFFSPRDFESLVSTNFTTKALVMKCLYFIYLLL